MSTTHDQRRIWSHFQAGEAAGFAASHPRLEYLLGRIARRATSSTPSLLNIGIGDGWLERGALERGWKIASLDPDEAAVARLVEAGVEAHVGTIDRLPFADASREFVVASEVLEHLDEGERTAGLAEIARVLVPSGWFLGTVPHNENLAEQETVCPHCGEVFHRWGHHASFTLDTVRAMLEPRFDVARLGRTAFVATRGRGWSGWVKGWLRIGLAKFGSPIAVPTIRWEARVRPR